MLGAVVQITFESPQPGVGRLDRGGAAEATAGDASAAITVDHSAIVSVPLMTPTGPRASM